MLRYLLQIILEILHFDMVLVGILEGEVRHSYTNMKVYFYLYETRWGTRHVRIFPMSERSSAGGFDNNDVFDRMAKRKRAKYTEIYRTDIKSWLSGRPLSSIPTYQKVKGGKWDFKRLLKGKAPFVLNEDEA